MLIACRRLDANTAVTDKLFQDVVSEALRQLYGYIGGSVHTHFLSITQSSATLKVDKRSGYVTFRHPVSIGERAPVSVLCQLTYVSHRDWSKLWSALTLLTSYNGVKCTVEVTSPACLASP